MALTWRVVEVRKANKPPIVYAGLTWDSANDILDQIERRGGTATFEPEEEFETQGSSDGTDANILAAS